VGAVEMIIDVDHDNSGKHRESACCNGNFVRMQTYLTIHWQTNSRPVNLQTSQLADSNFFKSRKDYTVFVH